MRIVPALLAVLLSSNSALSADSRLVGSYGFNSQRSEEKCIAITAKNTKDFGSCDVRKTNTSGHVRFDGRRGGGPLSYTRCISSVNAEYFVFETEAGCKQAQEGSRDAAEGYSPKDRLSIKTNEVERLERDIRERSQELECQVKDGLWTNGGGLRHRDAPRFCQMPYSDAGKNCKSSSDCSSGICLSRKSFPESEAPGAQTVGMCTKYPVGGGCLSRIEGGKAQPVICSD